MTGKERILAKLRGEPTDSLPLMPITMMFAADLAGAPYIDYARDHRVLADAQAGAAHICGARCEVPRGTPHANLEAMAQFARSRS
jgi:uroporphyrinogen-III decarboxylase